MKASKILGSNSENFCRCTDFKLSVWYGVFATAIKMLTFEASYLHFMYTDRGPKLATILTNWDPILDLQKIEKCSPVYDFRIRVNLIPIFHQNAVQWCIWASEREHMSIDECYHFDAKCLKLKKNIKKGLQLQVVMWAGTQWALWLFCQSKTYF